MRARVPQPRSTLWRRLFLATCWVLAMASGQTVQAQTPSDAERAIKATYLYKFGPFIEWPEAAFRSPDEAIRLCIVGIDPFGAIVEHALAEQQIQQRPIRILRMATADPAARCHILYAAGSPAQSVSAILATIRGLPVLTVTGDDTADPAAGIIHFVIHDGRVRFEVDDAAAALNGIAISSKVLSLALRVRPRI